MKLPAIQFYVGDWRKDAGVQALSFHDRGVWFEILCLMHESDRRGELLLNGMPMPEEALARVLGLDKQILSTTLSTLLSYGVASRHEESGALICRRMIRDENLRQIRSECGKKGGNPVLLKQIPTTRVKQIPTPSSSSSISTSPPGEERKPSPSRYGTFEQVKAMAMSGAVPVTMECAEMFFDRMEEIGWVDDKGLPLADWRARFRRYVSHWNANAQRNR